MAYSVVPQHINKNWKNTSTQCQHITRPFAYSCVNMTF